MYSDILWLTWEIPINILGLDEGSSTQDTRNYEGPPYLQKQPWMGAMRRSADPAPPPRLPETFKAFERRRGRVTGLGSCLGAKRPPKHQDPPAKHNFGILLILSL